MSKIKTAYWELLTESEGDMQEILENIAQDFDEFYGKAQEFIDKMKGDKKDGTTN